MSQSNSPPRLAPGPDEAFDVNVDEDELEGVETVKGAYELVTNKL